MRALVLALLRFYKAMISPRLPPACRFQPTCSEYAMDAVKRHGVDEGGLAHPAPDPALPPRGGGGRDPVP